MNSGPVSYALRPHCSLPGTRGTTNARTTKKEKLHPRRRQGLELAPQDEDTPARTTRRRILTGRMLRTGEASRCAATSTWDAAELRRQRSPSARPRDHTSATSALARTKLWHALALARAPGRADPRSARQTGMLARTPLLPPKCRQQSAQDLRLNPRHNSRRRPSRRIGASRFPS